MITEQPEAATSVTDPPPSIIGHVVVGLIILMVMGVGIFPGQLASIIGNLVG